MVAYTGGGGVSREKTRRENKDYDPVKCQNSSSVWFET